MRYSGNQRFAYRFNGSHFRRHAQATFNFGQPRSEDRGKGSAGANLGRRTTLKSQLVEKVSRMHLREICPRAALRRDEGQP
jgi:hypothetical protein